MFLIRQVNMGGVDQEHGLDVTFQRTFHHADCHTGVFGIHRGDQIFLRYIPMFSHMRAMDIVFQWLVKRQATG